jgi:hypothetical protein
VIRQETTEQKQENVQIIFMKTDSIQPTTDSPIPIPKAKGITI